MNCPVLIFVHAGFDRRWAAVARLVMVAVKVVLLRITRYLQNALHQHLGVSADAEGLTAGGAAFFAGEEEHLVRELALGDVSSQRGF